MSSSAKHVAHLRRLNDFYHAAIETYFELKRTANDAVRKTITKEEFTERWTILSKPAVESIAVSISEMYRWYWLKPKKKSERNSHEKERTIDPEYEPARTLMGELLKTIVSEYEKISSSTFDNLTPIQIASIINSREAEDLATSLAGLASSILKMVEGGNHHRKWRKYVPPN